MWLRMLNSFSKKLLSFLHQVVHLLSCSWFLSVLPLWPSMPFYRQIFLTSSHNILKWHPGLRGEGGQGRKGKKIAEKIFISLWKRADFRLFSGIKVSKCVYLAFMAVKTEHTVAGHNHDILQQCIFDVHASRSTGPKRGKIAKIYDYI